MTTYDTQGNMTSTNNFGFNPMEVPVSPTLIEGFKLQVASSELLAHFEKMASHHKNALEELSKNRIQLIGAQGETSEIVQKHQVRIKTLAYITKHIPENATYRLSLNELEGLFIFEEIQR